MRRRQRPAAACGPTRARGRAKRKERAAGPRPASDQETLKERRPTGSRMAHWRRLSAPGKSAGDRVSVDGGKHARRQRRPGRNRQRLDRQCRTLTSMTRVAVRAGLGSGERHAIDLGAVAACVGVWLARLVVVEVVVAACLGRDRPHRGRHPLAVTAEVARVEATPEGEVNHRHDGRDDANKGSHGCGLSVPSLSSRAPLELKRDAAKGSSRAFFRAVSGTGCPPMFPRAPRIIRALLRIGGRSGRAPPRSLAFLSSRAHEFEEPTATDRLLG